MQINGGDLFYDSHSSARGSPDELWTNKMAEEFRTRRGYALIPNLAALFQASFSFSDGARPACAMTFTRSVATSGSRSTSLRCGLGCASITTNCAFRSRVNAPS